MRKHFARHANGRCRPIAFFPTSVIFETSSHSALLEKTGVRTVITGVIDELMDVAKGQGCAFKSGFREHTMEQMIASADAPSIMYQDFVARRPMEVETYLGSPIKLAQEAGVSVPRIETLYALLHNVNNVNLSRPAQPTAAPSAAPVSPVASLAPTPRLSTGPGGPPRPMYPGPPPGPMGRGPMPNGMRPGTRAASQGGGPPPPPGMRRGPPSMGGYPPPRGSMNGNGYGPRPAPPMHRRPSFEANELEEFSHLMLYDEVPDAQMNEGAYDVPQSSSGSLALRERELALRQKELALREREYNMRRSGGGRMPPPPPMDDDDVDGDDYFDPMGGPAMPPAEMENIDMMSVTSRRTRKAPSASQLRANPEMGNAPGPRTGRAPWKRAPAKHRTSAALMNDMPALRQELMNNPMMGYSSDRYGNVDRHNIGHESRTNSLTAERLSELQQGTGPGNGGMGNRRGSHSPRNPPGHPPRQNLRPSPPNGYGPPGPNGRPSPPGVRQPVPRHPPGHGNAVAPQQIEQQSGVSNLYPPKSGNNPQKRSLTGSASASAESGESTRSAPVDSEPSAHSSASSFGPPPPVGVR